MFNNPFEGPHIECFELLYLLLTVNHHRAIYFITLCHVTKYRGSFQGIDIDFSSSFLNYSSEESIRFYI